MEKTNAMRMLDQKKIKYEALSYPHEEGVCVPGDEVARLTGENPDNVFKTLVCVDNTKHYHVCVIPVLEELDLKKAAKEFKVKALEMVHVKELFDLTGYVRGGCSPIGMKKVFSTIIDISAVNKEYIVFSGGKIGTQIKMNPLDLNKAIKVEFKDIKE